MMCALQALGNSKFSTCRFAKLFRETLCEAAEPGPMLYPRARQAQGTDAQNAENVKARARVLAAPACARTRILEPRYP